MTAVALPTRSIAVGGPWHGHLIESSSEEVQVKGTLYRRRRVHENGDPKWIYIWEGLDAEDARMFISEWTR